ncbi:hypothetical protein MKW92_042964 [Papaver armeniacum]|nr:hypothetical protein MKW92_042964 [Papaver armeniacum]
MSSANNRNASAALSRGRAPTSLVKREPSVDVGPGGPHPPGHRPGSDCQNRSHRGRRDWNSQCSINGRDAQQHQQMHPTMINPRNNYVSTPAVPPLGDHNLYLTTAKQIEYYFSPDSLWKNIYLRRHMDEQGWVHVSLIAGFHPVKELLKGISDCNEFMLDAVRGSTTVETKGDMIRRSKDWMRWILPPRATPIPVYQWASEANQMKDHL